LLSLELMSALFQRDFLERFVQNLKGSAIGWRHSADWLLKVWWTVIKIAFP